MTQMTAEQQKELDRAKTAEVQSWVKYAAVEAASRAGIPQWKLMRMRWVITAKGEGHNARLVLHGFQDPRLGLMKTASPTVSRRGRQIFLAMAAPFRWTVENVM